MTVSEIVTRMIEYSKENIHDIYRDAESDNIIIRDLDVEEIKHERNGN
jgi:hypothetical protein